MSRGTFRPTTLLLREETVPTSALLGAQERPTASAFGRSGAEQTRRDAGLKGTRRIGLRALCGHDVGTGWGLLRAPSKNAVTGIK